MNSPLLWDGACCELTAKTSLLTQECCASHQGLASCLSPLPHTAGSTMWSHGNLTGRVRHAAVNAALRVTIILRQDVEIAARSPGGQIWESLILSATSELHVSEGWEWPTDQTDPMRWRDHGWVCKRISGEREEKQISTGSKRVLDFAKLSENKMHSAKMLNNYNSDHQVQDPGFFYYGAPLGLWCEKVWGPYTLLLITCIYIKACQHETCKHERATKCTAVFVSLLQVLASCLCYWSDLSSAIK